MRKQQPRPPVNAALIAENGAVLAAMPFYEMIYADFFQAFQNNVSGAVGVITHKGSYIQDAQNLLCKLALSLDAPWKWLLLLEQDMAPPPGYISLAKEYPPGSVVGGLYYGRNPADQRPIPGWFDPDQHILTRLDQKTHDEWLGIEMINGNPEITHPENQGLHEIDVVGTGCTFIHRDVLTKWNPEHPAFEHERHTKFCNPRHFPWFQSPPGPDLFMLMSTDTYFCWHAREQGFKVYLDSRIVAGHMGPIQTNLWSHLAWRTMQPASGEPSGEPAFGAEPDAEEVELVGTGAA